MQTLYSSYTQGLQVQTLRPCNFQIRVRLRAFSTNRAIAPFIDLLFGTQVLAPTAGQGETLEPQMNTDTRMNAKAGSPQRRRDTKKSEDFHA